MSYEIKFDLLGADMLEIALDQSTKISEVITFLSESYENLLGKDKSRISITSRSLNMNLNQNHTIQQILGNQKQDTFVVQLNRLSSITQERPQFPSAYPQGFVQNPNQSEQNQFKQSSQSGFGTKQSGFGVQPGYGVQQSGYGVQQSGYQSQNISQGGQFNQQFNTQQQNNYQQNLQQSADQEGMITINFEYNLQTFSCELDSTTSLQEIYSYMSEQFQFQGKLAMMYQNQNLSNMQQSLKLKDLQIKNGSKISFVKTESMISQNQQQPQSQFVQQNQNQQVNNQGALVKIQFQIEDGAIQRTCILNCSSNQSLEQLKLAVLNYIGINSQDIADIDFYYSQQPLTGPKLQKTLIQLSLNKDNIILLAKVRWIGG